MHVTARSQLAAFFVISIVVWIIMQCLAEMVIDGILLSLLLNFYSTFEVMANI